MSLPVLYTPKQIADLWKVSRRTIYAWIKSGQLKAVKLGDTVRIPEAELMRFLKPVKPEIPPRKREPQKQAGRKPAVRKKRT